MEHLLATWGYVALFGIVFLSAMGIPVGSEVATGYAGALASGQLITSHHHLSLGVVIVVAVVGEVLGSTAGYLVGRFGGRALVDRVGKYVLLTHRDLDRAEAWFERRGEAFVFFGRFIPLLRSFVSLAAGLGEMAFGKFLAFTVLGCAMWCAALSAIGYSLGASWHHVIKDFSDAGYVLAALLVVAVVVVVAHRISVLRSEGARHSAAGLGRAAAHQAVRPLGGDRVRPRPVGVSERVRPVGVKGSVRPVGVSEQVRPVGVSEQVRPPGSDDPQPPGSGPLSRP